MAWEKNSAKGIKLTDDEKAILRHLKGFYYIYNVSGTLELTNKEQTWCAYELYFDDDVFQFIKEGEMYAIEELLDNVD